MRNEGEFAEEDRRREEDDRLDRDHIRRLKRERQGRVVKAVVVLAILVIFIVFISGNMDKRTVDFVFVESEVALIWVMLGCLILGVILGFFLGRPGRQFRFHREDDRDRDKG